MQWHDLSYTDKLKERAKFSLYVPNDPEYQLILKQLCKEDPIFLIEAFLFTKNPSKQPASIPFILYPYEKDLIEWMEYKYKHKEHGLIEKSRQMGVTWTTLAWIYSHWLFDDDFVALIGSRKEELVDKRDKDDTLFYKLDYFITRTPKWLLPKGFNYDKDRRHLLLVNKRTDSLVFGESSNPNFGRGCTAGLALLDEFAAWPEASASWDSLSAATDVKFVISTPRAATYFKTLRFSDEFKGHVKTIHWSQHPEKDQAWYEKQKEMLPPDTLSQEVDISYNVSGRGKVYEEFDLVPIGKYEYDPKLSLFTASDYGGKDDTAIIWAQKDTEQRKVYIIDSYYNNNKLIDFYVPFFLGHIPPHPFPYKESDYTLKEREQIKKHAQYKSARNYGDPAGKQAHQAANISVIQILNKYGIYVLTNDKANGFVARRDATKILMRYLYVDSRNSYFIECINQSRYPERRITSQATSPILRPIHDFSCIHGDTKIRTLNSWIPIKKLVGQKEIWLWSYSKKEKRLVPAKAHSARRTGKNAPLIEIGLDNGNSIKATPEHLFMMRDGAWKQCQNLKVNDSLMPYHRVRFIKKVGFGDIYDLTVPKYHNFVAEGVIVHNSHFRSALEYLAVNLKVEGKPPRKIDYIKNQIKRAQEGGLTEEIKEAEKKKKIIRFSYKSY